MQVRFGLRSSPCWLEHDKGKESNVKRGVMRSQRVDSDGVGAMVLGANNLIEFSDALQSTISLVHSSNLLSLFTFLFGKMFRSKYICPVVLMSVTGV